jgi:flagellar FliL protein
MSEKAAALKVVAEKADGAEAPAAAAKAPRGASPLIVPLLILNLGASGFVVFKTLTAHPAAAAEAAKDDKKEAAPVEKGPIAKLDPFVVNLDEAANPRYIKLTIELEMASDAANEALEKAKEPVRDQVLGYLSGLKVADTLGEANKQKIRDGLMARIQKEMGPNQVRRMFFTEFVVQ